MIIEFDGTAKTTLYQGNNKYLPGDTIPAVNYFPNFLQIAERGDIDILPDPRQFDPDDISEVNISDAEVYFEFTHPESYTKLIQAEQAREDDERKGMIKELQKLRTIASR